MRGTNQPGVSDQGRKSAYRLLAMQRHEVIEAAERSPDCAWLRRAMDPLAPGRVVVLGIFWLRSGSGLWPAIGLHVTFGGKTRTAMLYAAASGWRTATRLGDAVPWGSWAGRPEGEPGTVNGDEPTRGCARPAVA